MQITVIAGGVGSARFCAGLVQIVDPADVTVVVNTADDERIRGLHVSPDVDTVLYHLAAATDWERGWGLGAETFRTNDRYKELAARLTDLELDLHDWFALGDLDLATHLLRTHLIDRGLCLADATDALRRSLGIEARVLPMSNDFVRTLLRTTSGELLDFQTYFVRRAHAEEIADVAFVGADLATPAVGVIEAIAEADVVLIPPSNPLVSIAPVLAVPGVRETLVATKAIRVAISPIIGGRTIKGPADALLRSLGHEVSALGVARIYDGLIGHFVIDSTDAGLAGEISTAQPLVLDTIMSSPDAAARLAKEILAHVAPR